MADLEVIALVCSIDENLFAVFILAIVDIVCLEITQARQI